MGQALDDLARHNVWATGRMIAACRALDAATLDATVPGTYGSVIDTLRHIIDSEAYLFRLMEVWPSVPWRRGEPVGFEALTDRAAVLASVWERFLTEGVDPDRLADVKQRTGGVRRIPHGVLLTQAFHHANEHRAHLCAILSTHGHPAPDVSAWAYADATGRSSWSDAPDL